MNWPATFSVSRKISAVSVILSRGLRIRRRIFGAFLVFPVLLAAGGCALFRGPPTGEELVKDFQGSVGNQKDKAFAWVESSRKGQGDYDLLVTMRDGWSSQKADERRADALTLAGTWVRIVLPVKPEESWVEFVDSKGRALAWGLFQTEKGLFLRLGQGRTKEKNTSAKGSS